MFLYVEKVEIRSAGDPADPFLLLEWLGRGEYFGEKTRGNTGKVDSFTIFH